MITCTICRREIEPYLSSPCPNCASAVESLAHFVEARGDLDWAALKAGVVRCLEQHEQEIRRRLERDTAEAHHRLEDLRVIRIALERQNP